MESVTTRFADLTPELVEEVRVLLKPFFLRRTKDLVLNLPPLVRYFLHGPARSRDKYLY